MSGNTSATGGFLSPDASPPDDANLDDILQAMIVGITGIDGTLVRPRWQPVIPKEPPQTTDWCAIGVTNVTPDDYAAIIHIPNLVNGIDIGQDQLQRHEMLEIMATFYGPHSTSNATLLRDGLSIPQNREQLFVANLLLVNADKITRIPSLENQTWRLRADLTIYLRRIVVRDYAILDLASVPGTIVSDDGGSDAFDVTSNS